MTSIGTKVESEVRQFFADLLQGRMDSFYVSGELISAWFAAKICREIGIHCTYYLPKDQYRFERAGWLKKDLAKFQTIIA